VTKSFFTGVLFVLVVFTLAVQGYALYRVIHLAQQGTEAHVAVCAYKADLEQRAQGDRTYLALTPAQRRAKYGAALATIPNSVIQQGLHSLDSAIHSLSALNCEGR
jgi:hypothetical protein